MNDSVSCSYSEDSFSYVDNISHPDSCECSECIGVPYSYNGSYIECHQDYCECPQCSNNQSQYADAVVNWVVDNVSEASSRYSIGEVVPQLSNTEDSYSNDGAILNQDNQYEVRNQETESNTFQDFDMWYGKTVFSNEDRQENFPFLRASISLPTGICLI